MLILSPSTLKKKTVANVSGRYRAVIADVIEYRDYTMRCYTTRMHMIDRFLFYFLTRQNFWSYNIQSYGSFLAHTCPRDFWVSACHGASQRRTWTIAHGQRCAYVRGRKSFLLGCKRTDESPAPVWQQKSAQYALLFWKTNGQLSIRNQLK